MTPISIILAITILTGAVGGYAAFLIDNRSVEISDDGTSFRTVVPYLVLGIIAGACVPLFLSLVKSNLLSEALAGQPQDPFEQYLIYAGLCLVSAIYARRFISSISEQVLALERKTDAARSEASEAKETAQRIGEVIDEQEVQEKTDVTKAPPADAIKLSYSNMLPITDFRKSILEHLTHSSFRTATGIAKELGSERSEVGKELNVLADQGFINRTLSPKTGGPRWTINETGLLKLGDDS